jgi:hypothetical protein
MSDLYQRVPDLAIWVMDGGFLIKNFTVSPVPESEGDLNVRVNERVTSSRETLISLVKRIVDEEIAIKRAFDEEGE